ncbi:DNA repair protein xrcc1-like [Plakobranchus ocellatus]|uniref:DNA repair protein XRCC1 n=1 Tax=Plakobranchus ocellatus TaxID=259542 RepID=A0AAV4BJ36_9GAST|nr:DNA repair protein xrcc1-like [Plakobranchus ocellatus]
MPEIEIQHVVSFSSADKNNPADNLLKPDGSHKWKSAAPGEKAVSCVLQFTKCSQIHSIDIGNEGSAFVEVLVGKSAATSDKDFEVLLVASSFMSPLDSRNGTNRTSVRMFGPDKLNKVTANQKWDRAKIVCTQPFAKTSQYGLSFIKFHSPPEAKDSETKKFGAFTLKPSSDEDVDDIQVGSLFARRDKPETSPIPTGAAAIRAAGRLAEEHIKTATSATAVKRQAPSPQSAEVVKKMKVISEKNKSDSDTEEEQEVKTPVKPALRKQSTSLSSTSSSKRGGDKEASSTLQRSKTVPAPTPPAKEFSRLMENVVFVLSGFQNPYRGELRDKAMEMGAKYRPDWGRGCTHLICAFQNTPKYQQVSGKGKIVTKSWILDSHKMKKLLPWRKYRLGDADSPDESSEDEEETKAPSKARAAPQKKQTPEQTKNTPSVKTKQDNQSNSRGTLPQKGVAFDQDSDPDESEEDTDDELKKAAERKQQKTTQETRPKASVKATVGEDPYDVATDEEGGDVASKEGGDSDSGLPDLPDFFSDKHFFFYGDFEATERRLLTRYVAAYNGEEEDYMSKKINYVVTAQKWDDNFDEALLENPGLVFVKPKWIFACHEKNKLLPYQPYIIVPH